MKPSRPGPHSASQAFWSLRSEVNEGSIKVTKTFWRALCEKETILKGGINARRMMTVMI